MIIILRPAAAMAQSQSRGELQGVAGRRVIGPAACRHCRSFQPERTNAIAPGSTCGERMSRVIKTRAAAIGKSEADTEREYLDPTASKRMVDEEDVAATALFLASDEARNISGETIAVSGGFRV
jgi:NAD(P)-dependent dehydrogenase (short-subunit alcohol dehydrogenase family)